jgi:probable rRNA maturation factor
MITVEISQEFQSQIDSELLEKCARTALCHQSVSQGAELTIVITTDEQLHDLNRQFLGIDAPTDVLSFGADFMDPESGSPYLGDIIISFPQAARQAAVGEHDPIAEVQLLVAHGVLHLLGYDHAHPAEKTAMWAAQREILDQVGLKDIEIPHSE